VFNGRVYVHRDAQKSDASQSNRNLLLSRDAEIDTKPQLEIHADDVKCSHGATVGQLDEKMVFYLRSRGIDEAAARALLTYGFARDVADRMSITALREVVAQALLERLPQGEELRSLLS
jgi:Fe-S cluster assembly protein SufD